MLRPLLPADAEAAARCQVRTFALLDAAEGRTAAITEADAPLAVGRIAHLARTDPDGAWLAERNGEVVGVGLALRREQVWFLSLLVVDPALQSRGLGARLLQACLATAEGARGAYLCSSRDPRALRRYGRAGFRLVPGYDADGAVDRRRLRPVEGVREGDWGRDGERVDDLGRALRGAGYGPELEVWAADQRLLVADDGFCVVRPGRVVALGARDAGTAGRLLRAALAEAGDTVEVEAVTGAQQWALPVLLEHGLPLVPGGSVCVRGDVGPLAPYLPSGAYG